jgi:acyl dehydratase
MDEHREMSVTPDRYITYRYAGASGDFNPIHIDEDFARSVGLPGRILHGLWTMAEDFARSVGLPGRILHGLWTMAQVARAQTEAAGGPEALRRLAVQFRGMGLPEQEITITSTVRERRDGEVVVTCDAAQNGKRIIRNAEAVLRDPPA